MGQYDNIKAVASGGYTGAAENNFKTNGFMSTPVTTSRLPGESDAAYLFRLTMIQQAKERAEKQQEAIAKYQQEKQKRAEEHETKLRAENTKIAEARYKSILSNYNPNDLRSLQYAQSEIAGLKNFYTYNKLNKNFNIGDIRKTGTQTDWRIFNLKEGNENSTYMDKSTDGKNTAAFDFQPEGERDFLS